MYNNSFMDKKHIIIFISGISLVIYLLYIICTTKITIHFEDFEPFKHNLPVYYNGFRLGHTTKVYPSEDYRATLVDTRLLMKKLKLPTNAISLEEYLANKQSTTNTTEIKQIEKPKETQNLKIK